MFKTNIIYNEDCLSGMSKLPDNSIDAIICDLPYGSTRNSWDVVIPLNELWVHYKRIIKEHGAIILFGQGMFTSLLMQSNTEWWRYNLIWYKPQPTGFLNASRMPLRVHEDICVFYKSLPVYNPIMIKSERKVSSALSKRNCVKTTNYGKHNLTDYDSDQRYPISILCFPKDIQTSSIHPTQKPVDLIRYLVLTYTMPGQVILDNCMGSGTTAIACIKEKRNYVGFETNKEYYNKALQRIREEQRQLKLF